jgi:transcriptional regulator
MYLPASYREERRDVQFDLLRAHPLGLLVSAGPGGLMANPVPFTVYPDEGAGVIRAHVARANPQWQELASGAECLVVFSGPHAYISPSWYPSKAENHRSVPTWNYATVHVWGKPQLHEDAAWLRRQIDDLTQAHESGRPQPWKVSDAPPDFVAAQLQAIVGIEIAITRLEAKWKMSQNRTAADRAGVVAGLQAEGTPAAANVAELVARPSLRTP